MDIRPFDTRDADAWDELVADAPGATFLHSRRFLSYHGPRFQDASLVIERNRKLVGIFPAALDPRDPQCVVSHPGATYGGLIAPSFIAAETIEALKGIAAAYRGQGLTRLIYKTVPQHLTTQPTQADRYALWRIGATLCRQDLWSVVRSDEPRDFSSHLERQLRIAARNDLEIFEGRPDEDYRRYHALLSENLEERHGIKPVHTADELIDLAGRLGDQVSMPLVCPRGRPDELLAGIWLFRFGKIAWHTQYIGASAAGRDKRATQWLFKHLLDEVRAKSVAFLSYGAVTEQEGHVLNPGLDLFKAQFGGGHVVHDFFTLALDGASAKG